MAETLLADIGDLPLELGGVLPGAQLAYVAYGQLAPDGRNAILLTHGYTTSHSFVEGGAAASEGSWGELVGPGKPIDTDRFFVVSSNMLGSSFGSTGPRSINPATARPYGPDFPPITLTDIVAAQKRLLDSLGVKALVAVAGPSYGGFQAFEWGIVYPDFAQGLVAAVCALTPPAGFDMEKLRGALAAAPGWNGGWHYDDSLIVDFLAKLREGTLRNYGIDAQLLASIPDQAERDAEISRISRRWAEIFDPNSLLVLGDALLRFAPTQKLDRIRAKLLYALSSSDLSYPSSMGPEVMTALLQAGVEAEFIEIESDYGHLASGLDAAKWAPALRSFIDNLSQRSPHQQS